MSGVELLERSGNVWKCVICGHPFGTARSVAEVQIGPHVSKHLEKLEGAPPSRGGRSSSIKGGGSFLDFVGDIIDAITLSN